MSVKITKALESSLLADELDPNLLTQDFALWKAGDEYGSYLFGKDSAYVKPTVDGRQYALRHVHLVPLSSEEQIAQWDKVWKRRGRKTSDRALVYVSNDKGDHLLIYILDEPDAHAIAAMRTQQHRDIMLGFAEVAAAFLETGEILN
jgi:hypothetical protein